MVNLTEFIAYTAGVDAATEHIFTGVRPERVIFSDPATVVFWADGTKTVVKVQNGEPFDKEKGFAMAFIKKFFGNKGRYNELLKKFCGDS